MGEVTGAIMLQESTQEPNMEKQRKFTVILEPEETGGYSIHCPALPGCVSQGGSRDEALQNIREAIRLSLEVRDAEGLGSELRDDPQVIGEEVKQILRSREEDGLPFTIETAEVPKDFHHLIPARRHLKATGSR